MEEAEEDQTIIVESAGLLAIQVVWLEVNASLLPMWRHLQREVEGDGQ